MNDLKALRCPLTKSLFRDPVLAADGFTYERAAIVRWLEQNVTSPVTRQELPSRTLIENRVVLLLINELFARENPSTLQCQYKLGVHIRMKRDQPIFRAFGKAIYDVEWIAQEGPPIVLVEIVGTRAMREASFYIQLGSHPHVVRTFGFVENQQNSVMFVQECAEDGDLHELSRSGFRC